MVDSYYYGKLVVAPLNAVLYNVFNSNAGPELYGVEGKAFYLINLSLNFNLVLLGCLFSLPMLVSTILLLYMSEETEYSRPVVLTFTHLQNLLPTQLRLLAKSSWLRGSIDY